MQPPLDDDWAYATATDTAAAVAAGEVSSRELLEAALARVDRLDGPINAVVALDAERALEHADAADAAVARGDELGPLHGVPITIKDSFQTQGLVTTSGAPALADFTPERDADPVARYKAAGAIVFAKTNLPLFAGDAQTYNEVYGTTSNPYDIERTPGGSSGGSGAALAAGYTPLELGSDIGGSIRIPAHWCGVCGHKPSYGVVSALGQIPGMPGTLSQADIAVAGPMTRDAADLEMALEVLAGPDQWNSKAYTLDLPPARHRDIADCRVAVWLDEEFCPIDAQYRDLLLSAAGTLEQAGARVDAEARPAFTFDKAVDTFYRLLSAAQAGSWTLAELEEVAASSDEPHGELGIWHAAMRHREWLSWHERRLQQRRKWEEFFADWDVVLLPVTPTAAIRHDHSRPATRRQISVNAQPRPYFDTIKWMGLTGVSWLPSTVVPVGMLRPDDAGSTTADARAAAAPAGVGEEAAASGARLPVGVQIAGPFLEDRTTLAVARFLQEALGGFHRPPGF